MNYFHIKQLVVGPSICEISIKLVFALIILFGPTYTITSYWDV